MKTSTKHIAMAQYDYRQGHHLRGSRRRCTIILRFTLWLAAPGALILPAALFLTGCATGEGSAGDCGPHNCSSGCCAGDQCLIGGDQSSQRCGAGGASCQACGPNQLCDRLGGSGCQQEGSSVQSITGPLPCGAGCSGGCCDPARGCIPHASQNVETCGQFNQLCQRCGEGQVCSPVGVCESPPQGANDCDPVAQCWSQEQNRCLITGSNQSCGRGICKRCPQGSSCINGSCEKQLANSCLARCPDGCCQGNKCIKFDDQTNIACGTAIECKPCIGSPYPAGTICGRVLSNSKATDCIADSVSGKSWKVCVDEIQLAFNQYITGTPELSVEAVVGTHRSGLVDDNGFPQQYGGQIWKLTPRKRCLLVVAEEDIVGASIQVRLVKRGGGWANFFNIFGSTGDELCSGQTKNRVKLADLGISRSIYYTKEHTPDIKCGNGLATIKVRVTPAN